VKADEPVPGAYEAMPGHLVLNDGRDAIELAVTNLGDRPVQGGLKVCWSTDEASARKTVHRLWPTDAIPGEAAQLLQRHGGNLRAAIIESKGGSKVGSTGKDG